jgi:predicted nucleic acid-binding protein
MRIGDRVVVDASVAVKWVVDEPGSDHAVLLLDRLLVAPDLLCVECANILWKKVARRELTTDEADIAAEALEGAEIEIVPMRPYLAAAAALAMELDHPAYDCMYLAVAERVDLPVVTADDRFVRKVRRSAKRFGERLIALSEVSTEL